ncbi:hypothetical protein [Mesorhizobium sp.]|uniref:hypothetical protein n=1 Tax=Mesorhizobium sp. TaxID=1871066 RepID=UPI000FE2CC18|nr:hypothetical protein [Mesorhizobium sp.]RWJ03423.1 MAG: hypothetical protein EOR24_32090 [Mesorhizobium sp.]
MATKKKAEPKPSYTALKDKVRALEGIIGAKDKRIHDLLRANNNYQQEARDARAETKRVARTVVILENKLCEISDMVGGPSEQIGQRRLNEAFAGFSPPGFFVEGRRF